MRGKRKLEPTAKSVPVNSGDLDSERLLLQEAVVAESAALRPDKLDLIIDRLHRFEASVPTMTSLRCVAASPHARSRSSH